MQYKNYNKNRNNGYRDDPRYEEYKERIEETVSCVNKHLVSGVFINNGDSGFGNIIKDTLNPSDKDTSYFALGSEKASEQNKKIFSDIEMINMLATDGYKMNFVVNMYERKYLSVRGEEDAGTYICSFAVAGASKPVVLQVDDAEKIGLHFYVGVPKRQGVAYMFVKDKNPFFAQLEAFHYIGLRKISEKNYYFGQMLSYNNEWGWENISFGPVMRSEQDMVWKLLKAAENQSGNLEPAKSKPENQSSGYVSPWRL